MGYNILTILIFIICIGISIYENNDMFMGILQGIVANMFLFIIVMLILTCSKQKIGKTYEVVQYEIQGLQTNMATNGNIGGQFILGFGSAGGEIKTELSYYYFRQTEFGSKIESISQSDMPVYIKETNEQKPCLIYIYQNKKYNKFVNIMFSLKEEDVIIGKILVVPENTIKIEYNADLK